MSGHRSGPVQPGEVYGDLTTVQRVGVDGSRQTLWRCRCTCGGGTVASSGNLRSGRISHCPDRQAHPRRKPVRRVKRKPGQRQDNGHLTLVSRLSLPGATDQRWLAACDCERITVVWLTNWVSGNTRSCGRCDALRDGSAGADRLLGPELRSASLQSGPASLQQGKAGLTLVPELEAGQ